MELVVHQLDRARDVPVPPPAGPAVTLTRATLEALLEAGLPGSDDAAAVLLGTGRRPPTSEEASALGATLDRLPAL